MRPVTPLGIAAELAAGLDPYVERCTSPESPALAALARKTAARDWGGTHVEAEMLSGHVEGQFLKMLVAFGRVRRVLDIGMFTGYSALAMAEALPSDGIVVACEVDPDVAAFAQSCFPEDAPIDVRVGPAAETLATLDEPFDLVFLDADKGGYESYVETVLERDLLAPGGLLCVDNTLLQGEPWRAAPPSENGAAIAAFNEAVAADPRVEQVLVPLRDGITLIRLV